MASKAVVCAREIEAAYQQYQDDRFGWLMGLLHGCCGGNECRYDPPKKPNIRAIVSKYVREERKP